VPGTKETSQIGTSAKQNFQAGRKVRLITKVIHGAMNLPALAAMAKDLCTFHQKQQEVLSMIYLLLSKY
jgi:hypothetical protein